MTGLYLAGLAAVLGPDRLLVQSAIEDGIYARETAEADGYLSIAREGTLTFYEMALGAAQAALSEAGGDAADLAGLVYASIHRHGQPRLWSPASWLQRQLGIPGTVPVLAVQQGCNGLLQAIVALREMCQTDAARSVLFAGADRFEASGAIGLSEPTADELCRAAATVRIDAVQSEYSLWTRLVEADVLPETRRAGAALVCYSPLGRGLLRQAGNPPTLENEDFRRTLPRFTDESFAANARLFDLLEGVATEADMSVAQVMLCWPSAQGDDIIPIPGARKIKHLEQNVAATDLSLATDHLARLNEAFAAGAVSGDRYTEGKAVKSA